MSVLDKVVPATVIPSNARNVLARCYPKSYYWLRGLGGVSFGPNINDLYNKIDYWYAMDEGALNVADELEPDRFANGPFAACIGSVSSPAGVNNTCRSGFSTSNYFEMESTFWDTKSTGTISFWLKFDAEPNLAPVFEMSDPAGVLSEKVSIEVTTFSGVNPTVTITVHDGVGSDSGSWSGLDNYADGAWHHFSIRCDGSSYELFLDGASQGTSGTGTWFDGPSHAGLSALIGAGRIGAAIGKDLNDGYIDDLVFSDQLTDQEIGWLADGNGLDDFLSIPSSFIDSYLSEWWGGASRVGDHNGITLVDNGTPLVNATEVNSGQAGCYEMAIGDNFKVSSPNQASLTPDPTHGFHCCGWVNLDNFTTRSILFSAWGTQLITRIETDASMLMFTQPGSRNTNYATTLSADTWHLVQYGAYLKDGNLHHYFKIDGVAVFESDKGASPGNFTDIGATDFQFGYQSVTTSNCPVGHIRNAAFAQRQWTEREMGEVFAAGVGEDYDFFSTLFSEVSGGIGEVSGGFIEVG